MVRRLSFWNGVPKYFHLSVIIFSVCFFLVSTVFIGINNSDLFIYLTIYGLSALKIIPSKNLYFKFNHNTPIFLNHQC